MNINRKLHRIDNLERRIAKATGARRRFLIRDLELTRKSLGQLVWISSPHRPTVHMGEVVYRPHPYVIQGTFKREKA